MIFVKHVISVAAVIALLPFIGICLALQYYFDLGSTQPHPHDQYAGE